MESLTRWLLLLLHSIIEKSNDLFNVLDAKDVVKLRHIIHPLVDDMLLTTNTRQQYILLLLILILITTNRSTTITIN